MHEIILAAMVCAHITSTGMCDRWIPEPVPYLYSAPYPYSGHDKYPRRYDTPGDYSRHYHYYHHYPHQDWKD